MKLSYLYINKVRRHEMRRILRGFIPLGILRLRNYLRYRKWFPLSFIDGDSIIDMKAKIGKYTIIRGANIGSNVNIGDFTTIGQNTTISGLGTISIGRFCSIADACYIWSENHNYNLVTTYPLSYVKTGLISNNLYPSKNIIIGNDVWIGHGSIILAGAVIGDGSVIAAGSVVVNKEYPPYSIVAGVPAVFIKDRFSSNIKRELLLKKWWNYEYETIFTTMLEELESEPI